MAKQFGVSEEAIEKIEQWKNHHDLFTERETAALEFAEVMTKESNNVTNQLWSNLKQHFDDGEIIEIASVAGIFNYFNRFTNALGVDITR